MHVLVPYICDWEWRSAGMHTKVMMQPVYHHFDVHSSTAICDMGHSDLRMFTAPFTCLHAFLCTQVLPQHQGVGFLGQWQAAPVRALGGRKALGPGVLVHGQGVVVCGHPGDHVLLHLSCNTTLSCLATCCYNHDATCLAT